MRGVAEGLRAMSAHPHEYDPACPDCRPAFLDVKTGRPLPDEHPYMVAANRVFDAGTFAERRAYVRVCVHNSRRRHDLDLAQALIRRMVKAAGEVPDA